MNILTNVQEIFDQHELKPIELPKDFKDVYMFLRKYPSSSKDVSSRFTRIQEIPLLSVAVSIHGVN